MTDPQKRLHDALETLRSLEAGGYQARLAGGCVRDRLLGLAPVDYDIATTARPNDIVKHFTSAGRRLIPTGIAHGTVTLLMPAGPIEITTLRRDVATDGRHATVDYDASFTTDAARRDFTINAMFEDARGVIYDYFNGQTDLRAGVLRFVGDASTRIREDYLRLLRLFRFWARFGFEPAPGTLDAVRDLRDGLKIISQERATSELLKTLAAPHALAPWQAMQDTGIWALILPELATANGRAPIMSAADLAAWQQAPLTPAIAVLGGLLLRGGCEAPEAALALATRLRLAKNDGRRLAALVACKAQLQTLAATADLATRLAIIHDAEARAGAGAWSGFVLPVLNALPELSPSVTSTQAAELQAGERRRTPMPVSGHQAAAALGIEPGPELGKIMEELRIAYWNGFWTRRDEGLAWLMARNATMD